MRHQQPRLLPLRVPRGVLHPDAHHGHLVRPHRPTAAAEGGAVSAADVPHPGRETEQAPVSPPSVTYATGPQQPVL